MASDDGIIGRLYSLFKKRTVNAVPVQPEKLVHFSDPLGNFELDIPEGWSFDRDVIVDSGQYSISFEAPDRRVRFVVSVDTKPPKPADFQAYVKKECEGPASGILCGMVKEAFRDYPGFGRRFVFGKGNDESVMEDRIFLTAGAVFTLSMTYPVMKANAQKKDEGKALLDRMLASFVIHKGIMLRELRDDKEFR